MEIFLSFIISVALSQAPNSANKQQESSLSQNKTNLVYGLFTFIDNNSFPKTVENEKITSNKDSKHNVKVPNGDVSFESSDNQGYEQINNEKEARIHILKVILSLFIPPLLILILDIICIM